MSIVTVQLGQCGNQVGASFYSLLTEDATRPPKFSSLESTQNKIYEEETIERFFTVKDGQKSNNEGKTLLEAKCVMVDMEPKVIQQIMEMARKSGKWCYSPDSQYVQRQGSGNNWAQGYLKYGMTAHDSVIDLVRKQVEQSDRLGGFLVFMSLAGGTGSGLGAYLTHALHDSFANAFTVNQVVWPYSTGEVILQNYNSLLTLSHLYQSSDGIIAFENDHLNKICTRLLGLKSPSFDDINDVISHKLGSIFQPAYGGGSSYLPNTIGNLLESLCPHPAYKLLSVKNIPQMSEKSLDYTTYVWPALLKHLRQMLIADAALEEGIDWDVKVPTTQVTTDKYTGEDIRRRTSFNKSLANILILRGKEVDTADYTAFQDPYMYTTWSPSDCLLNCWEQSRPFNRYEKSATLVSNSQSYLKPLNNVIQKAWNMFTSRAYIHQYLKYGLTEEDFVESFGYLEQVLANYAQM